MLVTWEMVLPCLPTDDPGRPLVPETLEFALSLGKQPCTAGKGTDFAPKQSTLSPAVTPIGPDLRRTYSWREIDRARRAGKLCSAEAFKLKGPRGQDLCHCDHLYTHCTAPCSELLYHVPQIGFASLGGFPCTRHWRRY